MLERVVTDVRNLLARLIGENIELVVELADDLGLVKMDPAQVQQIILNLVLNARDAMPDGGRVTVYTRNLSGPGRDGNQFLDAWIALTVSDTGCGMDEKTRARLFEPFFTTKKPGQGNGLGLATVYRIVTHEGGTIEVESETGKGTRVVVHLPRVGADIHPPIFRKLPDNIRSGLKQKIASAKKSQRKRKINMTSAIAHAFNPPQIEAANLLNLVIVDDERAVRDVCREVAQSLGFNTLVAESAEHAYRLLESQSIDAVLLDLKLPGAGGIEALHKIKQRRPDAEVVVVTGYATVQSAVQAMKNGAYDYVTKPFTMDELKLSAGAGGNPLEAEN